MGVEDNKATVRGMLTGTVKMLDHLADDVRWTIPGQAVFCGVYNGKRDLIDRLMRPLSQRMATPGSFELHNLIGEGDHVVAQGVGVGRVTKDGRSYNNTYCMVFRFADSKIVQVDEYCDPDVLTAAFGDT